MNSLEQNQKDAIIQTLGLTGFTREQIELYDESALKFYWFLRANSLISVELPPEAVVALQQIGFFESVADLHSLKHLQSTDLAKIRVDGSPADLALARVLKMPNCKTQDSFFFGVPEKCKWFSIQYGAFSYNLPNYLWWLAPEIVKEKIGTEDFLVDAVYAGRVPVIQLGTSKCILGTPNQVLEFDLEGGTDPIRECVDSFLQIGITHKSPTFIEKILVYFPALNLYEFDPNWRYVFISPVADLIMASYAPGDTFFDATWKALKSEILYVPEQTAHLNSSHVDIFGTKVDLVEYALRPKLFVQKLKGEC